jgi:Holliday junction resolvase
MSDFQTLQGNHCLVGTEKAREYSTNDKKHPFVEIMLMNLALKSSKVQAFNQTTDCFLTKQINFSVEKCLLYFDFYKLPTVYYLNKDKSKKIDFEKVFQLLVTFSNYLMPSGRNIIMSPPVYDAVKGGYNIKWIESTIEKPQSFTDVFIDDENYLSVFDENDLVAKIVKYFGWQQSEVKHILEFLTLDLLNLKGKKIDIDIFTKPFIKVGKVYYWLSSFMKDRRWEVKMHSAILEAESLQTDFVNARGDEKLVTYDKVQIPDLEKNLAKEFENKGFKAVSGFKLYDGNNKEITDIDIVAYKNKCLYIIQAKCTKLSEELINNERWQVRKIEEEAFKQTRLSQAYLLGERFGDVNTTNLQRIKDKLEITCSPEDLRIIPIIVTNTFNYDGFLAKSIDDNSNLPILKMSIFELVVILRNSLKDMLFLDKSYFSSFFGSKTVQDADFTEIEMPVLSFMGALNSNSEIFRTDHKAVMKDCNFYKDEQNPQNEEIKEVIGNDKVWSFIPKAFSWQPNIDVLATEISIQSIMDMEYKQI